MYAVIFKATIQQLDETYYTMARQLRERALNEYGCLDFVACMEGQQELAVSYWPSLQHIKAWHQDPLHLEAQALGKSCWYASYEVKITQCMVLPVD